jgi:hypothetical protein
MKTVDVVQPAVVGLGDYGKRKRAPQQRVLRFPVDNGVPNCANAMGIGNCHRAIHESGFLKPGGASHFAIAV